jgi:DNA-binding PadR family transcriptional regulator
MSDFKILSLRKVGMPEPKITNLVKFYAVLLLSEKRHHGYELMKEIGKRLEKRVSPGQMYPFLAALEENRLVKAGKAGEREKTSFELTPAGKQFVKKNLNRFGGLLEIALQPHLSVCPCGCKIFDGGIEKNVRGKKIKFCCGHCAQNYH